MAFRAVASAFDGGGAKPTSIVVTKPTGVAENDGMVGLLILHHAGEALPTVTPPAGWTLVETFQSNGGATSGGEYFLYTKSAGSSEPANYTWSIDSEVSGMGGVILAYTSIDINKGTDGFDVDASSSDISTADNFDAPSITTTAKRDQLICIFVGDQDTDYSQVELDASEPSGMTARIATLSDTVCAVVIADVIASAEGATGVKNFTFLDTKSTPATASIALFNLGRASKKLVTPII